MPSLPNEICSTASSTEADVAPSSTVARGAIASAGRAEMKSVLPPSTRDGFDPQDPARACRRGA